MHYYEDKHKAFLSFLHSHAFNKGDIIGIVIHCGFSEYNDLNLSCHLNILGDGTVKISCDSLTDNKSHTWRRSKRRIGISVSCMAGAKTPPRSYVPDLKTYPAEYGPHTPTKHQIDSLVFVCKMLSDYYRLQPNQVCSHGFWALKDNYFVSNAWGLDRWGEPVMGDTAWDWWKEESLIKRLVFGEFTQAEERES